MFHRVHSTNKYTYLLAFPTLTCFQKNFRIAWCVNCVMMRSLRSKTNNLHKPSMMFLPPSHLLEKLEASVRVLARDYHRLHTRVPLKLLPVRR